MSRPRVNDGPCSVTGCVRTAHSKGMCPAHWGRVYRYGDALAGKPLRTKRYRDSLPDGFHSDVPLEGVGLFGAVVVCEADGHQLGPVRSATEAAMAIYAHQLRAHGRTGRHTS